MSLLQLYKIKTRKQFIQNQTISRRLYCSICQDVFEDPVRTACGHTFCYICIENWAIMQKKCPICKSALNKRRLQKDLLAQQIVDDLITKCTHDMCKWQGEYALLKKHQRWCDFKPKREEVTLEGLEVVQLNEQSQQAPQNYSITESEEVRILTESQLLRVITQTK